MMTLVATPPNLVVNSELLREKVITGFSFFSATPIGLVVLVLGILYMLVMRFMLKGGYPDLAARRLDAVEPFAILSVNID